MEPPIVLCNSLIKWLQSLGVEGPQKNATEISDGAAIARALVQITPEYFNSTWISKIKTDAGSNHRLKVSNMRKIVDAVTEYYHDILNLNIIDAAKPDARKIGEQADPMELGKLLQLVLGCAVNCEKKQKYITQIMDMEELVQQSIMQAIQSLEEATRGEGPFSMSLISGIEFDSRLQKLAADLETANNAREELAQRCHELELRVACLSEEKSALQTENLSLTHRLEEIEGSSADIPLTSSRSIELRKQVDMLKEDLYKMETSRDDYRDKVHEYERQISTLQERADELQAAADKAMQLKDEVDALTETAAKVQTLELALASYKKKLEEYSDLKKQVKILEDKNNEYYQQNLKYEEDSNKVTIWKSQIDLYKKQLAEVHQKLDEETQKNDKTEFENKKLETKLLAAQREKDNLVAERDALKETNEELRCKMGHTKLDGSDVAEELAAPELKERIEYLEKENRMLKSASSIDPAASAALLEDATSRQEQLRSQLRVSNQRILELEAKLEETNASGNSEILKQKYTSLQEALNAKEAELQSMKEEYKKCLKKAQDIVRATTARGNTEEILNQVRSEQRAGGMKEAEERLMTTAYYNLSEKCQREVVDQRLAILSAGQGATFLSRQRQPTSRRSLQPYKLK